MRACRSRCEYRDLCMTSLSEALQSEVVFSGGEDGVLRSWRVEDGKAEEMDEG